MGVPARAEETVTYLFLEFNDGAQSYQIDKAIRTPFAWHFRVSYDDALLSTSSLQPSCDVSANAGDVANGNGAGSASASSGQFGPINAPLVPRDASDSRNEGGQSGQEAARRNPGDGSGMGQGCGTGLEDIYKPLTRIKASSAELTALDENSNIIASEPLPMPAGAFVTKDQNDRDYIVLPQIGPARLGSLGKKEAGILLAKLLSSNTMILDLPYNPTRTQSVRLYELLTLIRYLGGEDVEKIVKEPLIVMPNYSAEADGPGLARASVKVMRAAALTAPYKPDNKVESFLAIVRLDPVLEDPDQFKKRMERMIDVFQKIASKHGKPLTVISYGQQIPLCTDDSLECWSLNRSTIIYGVSAKAGNYIE